MIPPLEHKRELRAHLALLVGREGVDDPVDGLRAGIGVKRREHKVTGIGDRERSTHRLQIPHLTDQDRVGILPKSVLERSRETRSVGPIAR